MTGAVQLGDNTFEQGAPANINIAGDLDDPNGPTYATFGALMDAAPAVAGADSIATVDRAGNVGADSSLARYGVTAEQYVPETGRTVASVFWDFMNATGTVYVDGAYADGPLFANPFYATGYPLTEAYWTTVRVGGEPREVLTQAFERRVLTYTPANADGWQVEAGNVGRHYYDWRAATLP